jgi:hypothetical protein
MRSLFLAFALAAASASAQAPAPGTPKKPPPSDAECRPLPAFKPFAFGPGETLEFDLDALGAKAGTMTMRVLPQKDGQLPLEVRAQTNTFFSKVRRVNGVATSYVNPKTLRPYRYTEDAVENEVKKTADVTFRAKDHQVKLNFTIGPASGSGEFRYANEGLDVAGAVYLMRNLPMKQDLPICFDVYGIRKLWRVSGKIVAKEHVSLPLGEFDAWHMAGEAVRLDDHNLRREIHVWITDDDRRLPLAALGSIDLGAIRATLTGFTRPGDKRAKAEGSKTLKW